MGPPPDDELNPRIFPILHDVPELVVRMLRKHYYAGVKAAEIRFRYNAADEDSLTGELGGRLTEPQPILIETGGQVFIWRTAAYKIRGRGANAPEGKIGADGIFQLEVLDQRGRYVVRKGLLFQAKKKWKGRDGRLLNQTRDLLAQSPSAIVVDFSDSGYKAIAGNAVVEANGSRRRIRPEDDKSLAEVLGDEFVGCTRGDRGLYWEPEIERLRVDGERVSDLVPDQFIGTRIQRVQ